MRIIRLEQTDSTNEYLKRENFDGDVIVTAKRQTAGRGTKGRSFVSDYGGLYVSVQRRYENFPAANAFEIMVNSCVAVCRTLGNLGISPTVRWANDVLVNGKKICGTLIENTFSGGNICRSIVGMGINVRNKLPEDLKDIATTVEQCLGKAPAVADVAEILIENLRKEYTIEDYKRYIDWFDRGVTLKTSDGEVRATALDVAGDGRLVVKIDGEIKKISSAEVSLRL